MPTRIAPADAAAVRALAKNKKRADALLADIRKRSMRIAEDAYAVGKALAELSEEPVYSAKGYKNFEELLAGEKLMSRSTAHRLIGIAQSYTRAQVKDLGVSKAYALLAYVDAEPQLDSPAPLLSGNFRIDNKRVSAVTVREINAAAKRARELRGLAKPPSSAEKLAQSAARKLQARLRKQGFSGAKASAVRDQSRWRVQVIVDAADAPELA